MIFTKESKKSRLKRDIKELNSKIDGIHDEINKLESLAHSLKEKLQMKYRQLDIIIEKE